MDKKKRLSQDLTSKKVRLGSSRENSPKALPQRIKSDGLGEEEGGTPHKQKSRGTTLSPKLPPNSPSVLTPTGSPRSSRSGSIDRGKAEGTSTSRPSTPTISNPQTNRLGSPAPRESEGADSLDSKETQGGSKNSKPDGATKEHPEAEEEEEENEEQISNEEYKLQVKNSGRTNEELR